MKYFDVRFSSQLAAPSAWPAEAPPLLLLDLPGRLQIPLATREAGAAQLDLARVLPIGTLVAKGQPLLVAAASDSSQPPGSQPPGCIHCPTPISPTSGRIVGMSRVMLLNGHWVPAVDLDSDFEDRPADSEVHDPEKAGEQHDILAALEDVRTEHLPGWIDRLRSAGIWADRPGSPDLLGQLQYVLDHRKPTDKRPLVDTVICNLLDDEPTVRLNSILAARSGPMLVAGLRLLGRLMRATNVWLIVEDSAPGRWWSPLRKLIKRTRIEIIPMLNDYPQSDATLLLHSLLGRRLPPRALPVEKGVLMVDAAAAISVGRYAARGQPMLQVPMAVRDHVHQRTSLLVAPIGASLRRVLAHTATPAEDVVILRGDVLQENEVSPDAVVAGGELTLHVMPRGLPRLPDPCIRCSWCVESCPTRVQPAGLLEAAQRSDLSLARAYGLDACIECGVCTYVCPSHLPLLAGIRRLKQWCDEAESQKPK